MQIKRIDELNPVNELYDGCCFPIVQYDETKRVTFQTIREMIANSAEMAAKLGDKVDKETGKGLSTNDFTNAAKNKLDGLQLADNPNGGVDITVGGITKTIATQQEMSEKMEFYKVDYDGLRLRHNGEVLTYTDLVEKYNDNEYFLYVEDGYYTYIPALPPADDDPIIEFSCDYLYGGKAYISRIIVNSDNQIKHEEIEIAKADDVVKTVNGIEPDRNGNVNVPSYDDTDVRRKLDALWKLNEGISYKFEKVESNGVVSVPTGAKEAILQNLRGKSIVWNQISTVDDMTRTIQEYKYFEVMRLDDVILESHKYFFSCTSSITNTFRVVGTTKGAYNEQVYNTNKFVFSNITNYLGRVYIRCWNEETGKEITLNKIQLFDLTKMFGAGNEPTIEQFDAMFGDDYYPYNEGELKSVEVSEFTVKGKNLYNNSLEYSKNGGTFERIDGGFIGSGDNSYSKYLSNMQVFKAGEYTFNYDFTNNNSQEYLVFGSNNGDAITINGSYKLTSLVNAKEFFGTNFGGYIGIDANRKKPLKIKATSDFMIGFALGDILETVSNIQLENGTVATPYKSYIEPTEYPITFVGKSAGTVRDELDLVNKKYIQRVGVVDLGSLTYYSANSYSGITGHYRYNATLSTRKVTKDNIYTSILGSVNYNDVVSNGVTGIVWNIGSDNTIRIETTDYDTSAKFKSAMQGVMLYYELDEPIITDVTDEEITAIVEGGGSITFDTDLDIGSTFNNFIALNEVT